MSLKKTIIPAVFCAFFTLSVSAQTAGTSVPVSGRSTDLGGLVAEGMITEESLLRPIEFLTDTLCEGRAMHSRGSVEASAWIAREFDHIGLVPLSSPYIAGTVRPPLSFIRSFRSSGKIGRNVIGLSPASGHSEEYIIVAAHFDNLGVLSGRYYPGADSNASGVSALLNLAHAFRSLGVLGHAAGRNVLFVALDGKQMSMAGASSLYDSIALGLLVNPYDGHRIRPEDITMMVNIDIVGSTMEPVRKSRTDYLIMLSTDSELQRRMREANMSSRLNLDLSFDYYGSTDFTDLFLNRVCDQSVFIEHKIPSVLFTSGITMNTNKTDDTVDSLDLPVLRKRTLLIFRWLERILMN